MRVSFKWLQNYVKVNIDVNILADKLTMSGIAVEEIEDQAAALKNMVAVQVLTLVKHEQADNLLVVKVDAGSLGGKQVITAAKNLHEGDTVPMALPGSILPNGKEIGEADFKGVLSQGMLCSGEELGLEKESAGIWIIRDHSVIPGTPMAEVLGLTDQILILELTANRSDCLGMIGVAREVAAILETEFLVKKITLREEGPSINGLAEVEIVDPELCLRYSARVVKDVKIEPSPEWMQQSLKAAGVRPINNIVDITNYVMLEYNQPLHAFDLEGISSHRILVRRAETGEKLVTLDETERQIAADSLLIADSKGGLCVAGVMGGLASEVTDKTTSLLLESAYFNPISIRKTAKALGMRTESSFRFERGIDPNGTLEALNRAAQLIEELGAGKVAQGYLDCYPQPVAPKVIKTTCQRINSWLGTDLKKEVIISYLERLTFKVTANPTSDQIEVLVPTYRQDVTHLADLAEEVARLYGYNLIPATLPSSQQLGERTAAQKLQLEIRRLLQGMGLSQTMTYSLYSKNTASRLGIPADAKLRRTVDLMVPLSEDQAVMRTNLVHNLLETMAFNSKRRQNNLSIYEIARVYLPVLDSLQPEEPLHLGIGLMGAKNEVGWNQAAVEADFYDLKGILELFFTKFSLPAFDLKISAQPFLHPGQAADIYLNKQLIGFLGQVHPNVVQEYGLTKQAYVMELDLTILTSFQKAAVSFEALPKFPAIQRDLALVVPVNITAASISARIKEIGGAVLEKVELFDVYQGEQVAQGQRSLAYSLSYRSKEKTLNDNEINEIQEHLLEQLRQEYGAAVRA